jgi:hypothetical protein
MFFYSVFIDWMFPFVYIRNYQFSRRHKMRKYVVSILLLAACVLAGDENQDVWENLFDGKTLNGWVQKNGMLPTKLKMG